MSANRGAEVGADADFVNMMRASLAPAATPPPLM
jgi:hypothetical protein